MNADLSSIVMVRQLFLMGTSIMICSWVSSDPLVLNYES